MTKDCITAIVEELAEVQTMEELKALWCFGQFENNEFADAMFVDNFKVAVARLRAMRPAEIEVKENAMEQEVDLATKVAELMAQIEALKAGAAAKPPVKPIVRGSKRYRLLKVEVDWSTKPQVHALMQILGAHAKPGDVLDEADIIRMMVENEVVLQTRQGGKRIWDYYKGDHHEGLVAHGNIQKV